MKYFSALLVVIVAIVFVGSAMAVPSGKTLEFAGGGNGKVEFSGKVHADKGLKCGDCHTKIFPMKGPGKDGAAAIKMDAIKEGKFCGACHNGTKAFNASDAANCSKCHKK
ncbi:MAG: cytochrome C [Nitrospirae bacterium]|nr:cytochrome C [Nitrospirota bacterium]